jgi:NADPH-dependent ferric siderophore reductase
MLPVQSPQRPRAGMRGRLSKALRHLLMKHATIVAVERLAECFRLITLEGPARMGIAWTPGQKIQIAMDAAFVTRTYTPFVWDASAGRTCILGYEHGDGPGSAWVRGAGPGDECDILGPRASLDTSHISGPLAVYGDETSIGLAYSLIHQNNMRSVACHFEVRDARSARQVVAKLGMADAALCERREDDTHLEEMEAAFPQLVESGVSFVLTGRAAAVQRLRQRLRQQPIPAARVTTKAYWALGKAGLD